MEKISGLVLDMYDTDPATLQGDLATVVKEAAVLTADQLDALPDDLFALVMSQDGMCIRKYACVDADSTALNVMFLTANSSRLPEEVVKCAAHNLEIACGWYGVEPTEELKKLSTGVNQTVGRQQVWREYGTGTSYRNNPNSWSLEKVAEVTGTLDMPLQGVPGTRKKLSTLRTAGCANKMRPHIDVTRLEAPVHTEKKASTYAMPSLCKFPIDGIDQIKRATAYFGDNGPLMAPADRREFAHNLYKRASAVGLETSEYVERYGFNKGYAKEAQINCGIQQRLALTRSTDKLASTTYTAYDALYHKRSLMQPDVFARELYKLDKVAGLSDSYGYIDDPWLTTFGKVASDTDVQGSTVVRGHYVRHRDLALLARIGGDTLEDMFGDSFVELFRKDPINAFKSAPVDQQVIIANMVNSNEYIRSKC